MSQLCTVVVAAESEFDQQDPISVPVVVGGTPNTPGTVLRDYGASLNIQQGMAPFMGEQRVDMSRPLRAGDRLVWKFPAKARGRRAA